MKTWKPGASATFVFAGNYAVRATCAALAFLAIVFFASPSLGQCTVPIASAPTLPSDTIWMDDDVPPDSSLGDTWVWDTTQKASGTQSHTQPGSAGVHQHFFTSPVSSLFWVSPTDTLVTYVLLDPCDPPTELMLQFTVAGEGWDHRAYWGEDVIGWGVDGTESLHYMGPLPATGQWVRLEIPAAAVGVGSRYLAGIAFTLNDGHAWFDRSGKAGTCSIGTPQAPANLPTDTVWFDDALPEGGDPLGTWIWDTTQKMSGTASHTESGSWGLYGHQFDANGSQLSVAAGETIVQYVLLDPCETPRELMLAFSVDGSWEHRAYWGEDLIEMGTPGTPGRLYMGALPPAGSWARLEIPASLIGISDQSLAGMAFLMFDGRAWFDRTGKNANGPPVLTGIALNPTSVQGGGTSSATVTLASAAPAGGAAITLLSSDAGVATVPATVTVAAGQTSAAFTVGTLYVVSDSSVTISAVYAGVIRTAELSVAAAPPALLASLNVTPASVFGGGTSQGTVTVSNPAPPSGKYIFLSSSNLGVAYVPNVVVVAQGQTSATFTVVTTAVDLLTSITITASADGIDQFASLDVIGPILSGVSASPSVVAAGTVVTGTVTLTNAAPPWGTTVSLSSSDASATVSDQVTIAPGANTATFSIATHQVATSTPVTITASRYGVNQTATLTVNPCTFGTANAPSSFSADTVWFDDDLPPDSSPGGTWNWDTSQHAMGLKSSTEPSTAGFYQHYFVADPSQVLHLDATDKIVVYALLDPCDPPRELMLQFNSDSWEHRVFWGENLIGYGNLGTPSLTYMGALPATGQWVRLEVPASLIGLGNQDVLGMAFSMFDGKVWFDRVGKIDASGSAVLNSLSLSPASVVAGSTSTGTVSLSGAAPSGGAEVSLSSSDTAVATVPANVTIASGATAATFTASVLNAAAGATSTITASYAGDSRTATLTVASISVTGISVSPGVVEGGTASAGTVTISAPALAGGLQVSLGSSDTSAASVPATVTVASGSATATFTIVTSPVSSADSVVISASGGGATQTTTLIVTPSGAALASISLSPSSVAGGSSSTGTVTLTSAAGAGGFAVNLTSDNVAAIVPAGGVVVVPAGTTATTFAITTSGVSSDTSVTITASANSVARTATLTITPCSFGTAPAPSSFPPDTIWFDDAPPAVVNLSGTWIWDAAQKASGTQSNTEPIAVGETQHFLETSGSSNLQLNPGDRFVVYALVDPCFPPSEIMIQWRTGGSWEHRAFWGANDIGWGTTGTESRLYEGAIPTPGEWARFELTASSLGLEGQLIDGIAFTLYDGRVWFDHVGKVNQDHTPVLASVSLDPASVAGGAPTTGTITLTGPAPEGGVLVSLSSSSATVASVPATATVPAASTSATFSVTTTPVGTDTSVTLTATDGSETRTAVVTVTPPGVASLTALPASVVGAGASVGTVTLTNPAPAGGATVSLSSANPSVVGVPAAVAIDASATSATFAIATSAVSSAQGVAITATYGASYQSTTLTVNPPDLTSVSLSPPSVTGGSPSTGTVTLNGQAPSAGVSVALSSSSGYATLPASVTVVQGATTATFTVTTASVGSVLNATVTATQGSTVRTAVLTLNPPGAALSAVSLNPATVSAGSTSTGTVTLTMAAPTGGFAVNLSSDNSAATVPAAVTVAQGTTSATFTVTTSSVSTAQTATITAAAASVTVTAPLTINPLPVLSALSLAPASVTGGSPSTGTVTLTSAALAGGYAVSLSSDSAAATVPGSVTIAEGATTATFMVTTTSVSANQSATITATAGAISRTASLLVSRPVPTGELTEGNASDWVAFASDSAATSLSDDTTRVRVGASSLKLVTASGGDTGIRYPAVGQVVWDLSSRAFLSFWAYIESSSVFAGNQPTVVLLGPTGSIQYTPASPVTYPNQWHHYEIALSGDSGWTRTVTGIVDLSNISGFEIHHQASPAGFTAYYDGLAFVTTLDGDFAEGNAGVWGAIDSNLISLENDTTHVRSGVSSIDYLTNGATAVAVYPAAGSAHWDLSKIDSLSFWVYEVNSNIPPFQGAQPVVVLQTQGGAYTYTPAYALMSLDTWRLYQVPLSGGGPWTRSSTGSPVLSDVNQVELHFGTWGYGFELFIDGLSFGRILPNLTLSPTSLVGGTSTTATVTLLDPAPAGGSMLTLTSSDAAASVPATLPVPAGATTATFEIATTSVSTEKSVTISWTDGVTTRQAVLDVTPSLTLIGFSIDPLLIVAGGGGTGTVALNGPAPTGGMVVTLSSAFSQAVSLPSTVTIAAGASLATFAVQTYPYFNYDRTVATTASAAGVTKSFALYVARSSASNLASVSFSPTALVPGDSATGTVTLTAAAPAGGTTVGLTSSNVGVASVPDSATVPPGAFSVTFPITISASPSGSTSTIAGSLSGVTRSATVRLTLPSAVMFIQNPVVGGQSVTGTVALTAPAPAAGLVVNLTSSNATLAPVPGSVSVAPGSSFVSFSISTATVSDHTPITITATCLGVVVSSVLNVEVVGYDAFTISAPLSVKAGASNTLYVVLKSPAPAGGTVVSLTSSGMAQYEEWADHGSYYGPELLANTTLTILSGATSGSEVWVVPWSSTGGTATLTVTLNGISKTIAVQVSPGTATFSVAWPSTVSRGGTIVGSINFDGWALSPGSMPVSLSSGNPGVVLTSTSLVASSWNPMPSAPLVTSWSMLIGVTPGSATGSTALTATFAGLSASTSLIVNPSVLTSMTAAPATFRGGTPVQVTVNLDTPAPPEGALISLSSSNSSVFSVPATVLVAAGQQSASLTATPQVVGTSTPVTLSATYGPNTRTLPLKVWSASSALVTGVVLDARVYDHDQPLSGIGVSLTTDPSDATTTDVTGVFNLYVEPGSSAVSLASPGFATTTLPGFTVSANGTVDEGATRLKYVLGGPTAVSGRVITAAGVAVSEATGSVEGYQGSFTTDSNGHYSFNGPSLDPYRLTFSAMGYPSHTSDTFVSFGVENQTSQLFDFVLDTTPRPTLAAISITPNLVVSGSSAVLRLTLTGPAPSTPAPGGMNVTLDFSNPLATPSFNYATIPAGQLFGEFSVPTSSVLVPQTTTITGFAEGVQLSTTLTVVPATGVLSSVSVSPTTVEGGSPSTGTVTLSGPAPSGGAAVALSSNDAAASVPASVTVLQGATTATFTIATSAVASTRSATITAVYGYTRTTTLTLNPPPAASLIGVAPGWVLPGDTTPVIYGSNIQPGSTVTFTGPVYSLTDFQNPLCTTCPSQALAATVDVNGMYAAFAVPVDATPGAYSIKIRSTAGVDSSASLWIAVDSAQQTRPVVPAEGHATAMRIYPGQTVTGTLSGDVPLNGISDYNYYYFVATAGSQVSLTMNRVDTSVPWENPSSLDPQIEIVAPNGFIYANLQGFDNQPSIDLNASITNAVLPETGVYIIAAETTRGSGAYQLSFNVPVMAPAPVGNRAIAVAGNDNTLPLHETANVQSVMLDSRGWPVAGASYSFSGQNGTGDVGTATFQSGATGTTAIDGSVMASFQMTAAGKARFKASLDSPLLSALVYVPYGDAAKALGSVFDGASGEMRIPVYQAAAHSSARVVRLTPAGAQIQGGAIRRHPQEQLRQRIDIAPSPLGPRSPQAAAKAPAQPGATAGIPLRAGAIPLATVRTPLTISSCSAELEVFTQAGVTPANVNAPFSVTLTDVTEGEAQGVVDTESGIHGHRIEKADGSMRTLRFHLDVKDSTGATPTHPVLVSLTVGGPAHGTLILDPDAARLECSQAAFIWHEQDAQGNIIALNEEFEYRLGTLAVYAGAIPDPVHQGQVLPVWGVTEDLQVTISTVDGSGSATPLTTFAADFDVHPEPGKPTHFLSPSELNGGADDHTYDFWTSYLVTTVGGVTMSGPYRDYNSYYLVDRWNNVTFGYNGTQPVSSPQNVTVSFTSQLGGSNIPDVAFPGYETDVSWSNIGGAMPTGNQGLTLSLIFNDAEYGSNVAVTRPITLSFLTGPSLTLSALISQQDYDLRFGVDDTGWPISVPPAATGSAIPGTSDPRSGQSSIPKRLCFQIVTGTSVPYAGEIYETPHNVFDSGVFLRSEARDPHLETSEPGHMKLSVIDATGNTVTDIAFKVHNCPHYDHEGSPNQPADQNLVRVCSDTPAQSAGGVIPSYSVNPAGSSRGYMGIELLQAPTQPGNYYIKIESLDQIYRIRQLPGLTVDPTPAGGFKGAFALCVVQGAEIVDENFKVANQLLYVATPKQYRVRYTGASSQGLPTSASIDTKNSDNTPADSLPSVALTRVGVSNLAYSDLFTLNPPLGGSLRASRTALTAGSLDAGTGVTGLLEAIVSTQTVKRDTEPQVIVELTIFDGDAVKVPTDVQRNTGYLLCPDADDDDLNGLADYTLRQFPVNPADTNGRALLGRKRQDTVQARVTRTAKPSDTAKLMIRGSTNGDSALNLYWMSDGIYAQMPYQIPWERVTQADVNFFAETAGPNPVELTLYLEDGPAIPDDKAKFHGCDGSYFFISGAGHEDSGTHYIQGFRHSLQSQRLCGFTDLNETTGVWDPFSLLPVGDLAVVSSLFYHGLDGLSTTDVAYQKVQAVLSSTAAARAAGKGVLIGYSYGATLTAVAAIEARRQGTPFSFCGLIGAPIGSEVLANFRGFGDTPAACMANQIVDIPGDAIEAGVTTFSMEMMTLILQMSLATAGTLSPFSAPHWDYAHDLNDTAMQQRRDSLIKTWKDAGFLTGQCPVSQ